jgi:uncharacterized membrane protein (UPF0127 family)
MDQKNLLHSGRPTGITIHIADSFRQRLIGLIGKEERTKEGLLLQPANSIHTFFMRFSIDAVFIGACGEVIAVVPDIPPGKIVAPVKGARAVLELPRGTIGGLSLQLNDRLTFE